MNRKRQEPQPEEQMGIVPKKDTPLFFTGERYLPSVQGEIRLEHLHRYAVALDIASDKDVLDIACGEGYGSFLLSTVARRVTGVDISEQAVRHAHATYGSKDNLVFKQGSAAKIELPDESFDVVISFETIEHLAEQSQMLAEIRRVLRAKGVLLISSPNRPIYSEASGNHNQFHVKELDFMELDTLVRKQFRAVQYLGQRMMIASIVQALGEPSSSILHAWRDNGVNALRKVGELSEPVYFLAICAADEAVIPRIEASIMQPDKLDLLKQYVGFARWATETNKELELSRRLHGELNEEHHKVATWVKSLDQQIIALNEKLSERDRQVTVLSDQAAKLGERAVDLENQLKTTQAERDEFSKIVSERDSRIARLDQTMVDLNENIAKLSQKLFKIEHDLVLQEQVHANELQQNTLGFEQEKTRLVISYAEREHELHERLLAAQGDLQKNDHEWVEKFARQSRFATEEKAALQYQMATLRQQIHESDREKMELSDAHADREHAFHERLLAAQSELRKLDQEWAGKWTTQQLQLLDCDRSNAELRAQIVQQIDTAKHVAATSQLGRRILEQELETIKGSMSWLLTKALRRLARRRFSVETTQSADPQQRNAFDAEAAASASAESAAGHQDTMHRYFEEVGMTTNCLTPALRPHTSISSLDDLLDQHDEAFIHASYRVFLRRTPDADGMAYYLRRLRRGVGKVRILDQIRRSKEGKLHDIKLDGLDAAVRRGRWLRLPFIGALLGQRGRNQKLDAIENQLFVTNEASARRFDQLEKAIMSLQPLVVQQAQTIAGAALIRQLGYASIDSWRTVEEILSYEGRDFLNKLFYHALARHPEAHEANHYLHLLGNGTSKLQIVGSLFSCEECRSRLAPMQFAVARTESKTVQSEDKGRVEDITAVVAESVRFAEVEQPLVSIVIPVYGKIGYTLTCLKSIQKNLPKVSFEIIVVDDKSSDNTATELSKVQGIKLIANTENLGFIRSCNRGAAHARGNYLCFLNNDTEVTEDWLDELVRTFYEFPGTGLSGSKLIYPNGSLQEAGGILWRDGSAWNFGRNQDPLLPVYNYAREVDYCSGASIMIPNALFKELEGFDEHYLPAYCEDSDLALKIRERGHRVIYQPLSVVVHYEGITSGTDTSQGAKAYQIENSKKLFTRWNDRLKHHQENGKDVDDAKDRMAQRRVLVLDHCTPTPDQDAGSVTVFNLLLLLREMDFQVTFIPEDNFLFMPEYTTKLQRIGVEVLYAPYHTSVEQHLQESGSRYELAFLFRPVVVERHLKTVRKYCPKAKVLYHTVDLHYLRMMREAQLLGDSAKRRAADEMKQREFNAIRSVDASIVHSTTEFEILRPDLPKAKIHVFPLILDVRGTGKQYRDRSDIVFVGGYQHAPNVDAVQYFVKEIMPLLRQQLPGIRVHAVGSNPPQSILDLASEDVIVTGFVEDLNPFLDKMRIAIAPLRYGAGIKGKIGTAMAAGLPTVATSLAVEGMSLTPNENVLVSDGPDSFAAAVTQLYMSESIWMKLSENGIAFAKRAWGSEAAYRTLRHILMDMEIVAAGRNLGFNLYSHARLDTITERKEI